MSLGIGVWVLVFGIYLDIGIWYLEFGYFLIGY